MTRKSDCCDLIFYAVVKHILFNRLKSQTILLLHYTIHTSLSSIRKQKLQPRVFCRCGIFRTVIRPFSVSYERPPCLLNPFHHGSRCLASSILLSSLHIHYGCFYNLADGSCSRDIVARVLLRRCRRRRRRRRRLLNELHGDTRNHSINRCVALLYTMIHTTSETEHQEYTKKGEHGNTDRNDKNHKIVSTAIGILDLNRIHVRYADGIGVL